MAKAATIESHISEMPQVRELAAKLAEAQAKLATEEAELDRLFGLLNPLPTSSTCSPNLDELGQLKAQQELPVARERYLTAKAAVLETKPRYEQARLEALRKLTDARNRARLPLLRQFADALDAAKVIGEEIQAFDRETVRLGGYAVEHPLPWLIDELPWRHGEASRIRQEVERLEGN